MNHAPLPDSYYANELWHDSPLTDDERESLRNEIRQLVLAIKEETHLDENEHPGIDDIELTSFRNEDALNITVYLASDELEVNPVGTRPSMRRTKLTSFETSATCGRLLNTT